MEEKGNEKKKGGGGVRGTRKVRGEEGERLGSAVREDEVGASEAANECRDVGSGTVEGGVGRGTVHLPLSLLGYHNHLSGSQFALIQPLTRAERQRAGAAPCGSLPLSQLNVDVYTLILIHFHIFSCKNTIIIWP